MSRERRRAGTTTRHPDQYRPASFPPVITAAVRSEGYALVDRSLQDLPVDAGTYAAIEPIVAAFIAQLLQQTADPAAGRRKAGAGLLAALEAPATRALERLARLENLRDDAARRVESSQAALTEAPIAGRPVPQARNLRGALLDRHTVRWHTGANPPSNSAGAAGPIPDMEQASVLPFPIHTSDPNPSEGTHQR